MLDRLADALRDAAGDDRARDLAILRFELAFEVAWRLARTLALAQGLVANSPREAFSQAFRLGWTTDEAIWVEIIRARNEAVHVYHEDLAKRLAGALAGYLVAFRELCESAAKRCHPLSRRRVRRTRSFRQRRPEAQLYILRGLEIKGIEIY